jgi:hypothetical protein
MITNDQYRPVLSLTLFCRIPVTIAVLLDSLLLHGVAVRPCFGGRARRRKHARTRNGLKTGSCTEGSY